MPKTKSAKKALRQNLRRRKANLTSRANLKAVIKKYEKLLTSADKGEAKKYLPSVYKTLDKAAKRGLIKINTASRLKKRLTRRLK